jgi:glycosyltransferase involved in cell wall biosynthesis
MKFSIIIPTLNEEKYIEGLLDSLASQIFKDFEVLVIDARSEDRTKEKVLEYKKKLNIKFIKSPTRGVGFQRNYGAGLAKCDDLIFFDADITIEKDFLEKITRYLESNETDVLTSWFEPLSTKKRDKVIFRVFNIYLEAIKFISPGGGGAFIYAKKKLFLKIGGFSEDIVFSEDFDLFRRMDKEGFRYKLVRNPLIKVSVRRLNKEGRFFYTLNLMKAEMYRRLKGPIKDRRKIKYEFGNYN